MSRLANFQVYFLNLELLQVLFYTLYVTFKITKYMKTTSIYTWYKKVNNLIAKNIEKINVHGFTIDVSFMDIEDRNKSVTVHVFDHAKEELRELCWNSTPSVFKIG